MALSLVTTTWKMDVQEIEGVNNLLQSVARKCPNISLALLDARVALRKLLGLGSRDTARLKWSLVAPTIDDIMLKATHHVKAADVILAVEHLRSSGSGSSGCGGARRHDRDCPRRAVVERFAFAPGQVTSRQ